MKKSSRIVAWIVLILWFVLFSYVGVKAQNQQQSTIERQGNTFIQKSNKDSAKVIKTNYVYVDSKGQRDTIYLSPTGKCFVFKVSNRTGNVYKKYLPEITEALKKEGKI